MTERGNEKAKTKRKTTAGKSARRKTKSSTSTNRKNVKRPTKQNTSAKKKTTTAKKTAVKQATPKKEPVAIEAPAVVEEPIIAEEPKIIKHETKLLLPVLDYTEPVIELPQAKEEVKAEVKVEVKRRPGKVMDIAAPKREAVAPILPTPKEVRDRERKETILAASFEDNAARTRSKDQKSEKRTNAKKQKALKVHFGWKSIMLALCTATLIVLAVVMVVDKTTTSIPLRVAAMQTGIDASYPSYVPRDFDLSDITSENGKITLNFKNATTGDAFSLIEEKSSWDSSALYANYVQGTFGEDAAVIKEQGLTLYISGSNAAWVNGGIVYKLKMISGTLTKKQIKAIAVSL